MNPELARQYGFPFVGVRDVRLNESALISISAETARRLQVLPLKRSSTSLLVAIARVPTATDTETLLKESGMNSDYALADPQELAQAIERAYPA